MRKQAKGKQREGEEERHDQNNESNTLINRRAGGRHTHFASKQSIIDFMMSSLF